MNIYENDGLTSRLFILPLRILQNVHDDPYEYYKNGYR